MNISTSQETRYTSMWTRRKWRKIHLERIPSTETQIKLVVANNPSLPIITWNVAAVPHPELAEPWVNDTSPQGEAWTNDTRPVPTEPDVKLSHEREIQYRRCDCALAVDWCWCAITDATRKLGRDSPQ